MANLRIDALISIPHDTNGPSPCDTETLTTQTLEQCLPLSLNAVLKNGKTALVHEANEIQFAAIQYRNDDSYQWQMLEIPQLDIAGTPKEISGLVYQLQSSKKAQKEFAHYLHHSPVVDTFVAQTLEALALGNIWSAQIAGDFFAGIDASATQKDLLSKMSNAGAAARILF